MSNASPSITAPQIGPVTAAANLTVTVDTNRDDLAYLVTMHDVTGRTTLVYSDTVAAPGVSPFSHVIPALKMLAGRTFQITVQVDPGSGTTPPHSAASVVVTT